MGFSESVYNKNAKMSRNVRRINADNRRRMDVKPKVQREVKYGARKIFIDEYIKTRSYLQAKQKLRDRGFSDYEDEILQNWIKEECKSEIEQNEKGDER